ncbi:hypothetical protein QFZ33_002496 [Arthrobacter globiformis]|nr:hypothetical protein [Arthrobacter globiformis]
MTHEEDHPAMGCTISDACRCRTPVQTIRLNQPAKAGFKTRSRSLPVTHNKLPSPAPSGAITTSRTTILRWQVLKILNEVFDDPDTTPDARRSLLQQMQENPGHPELALLAHLGVITARTFAME